MTSPTQQALPRAADVARFVIDGGTTRLRRIWQGLQASFGLRVETRADLPADESTELSRERTHLALERSYLACDRTLQAWIRTSLSMISFGFTLGKLGQAAESGDFKGMLMRQWSVRGIAYFLVILGTLGLLAAIFQHLISLGNLRVQGFRNQPSISFFIAAFLTLLGGFAFSALVLHL